MQNHRVIYLRTSYLKPSADRPMVPSRQAIGCVALTLDQQKNEVRYQYSVVNPLDDFKKNYARNIATIRLQDKPFAVPFSGEVSLHRVTEAVMQDIATGKHAPKRAQKAAKLWLNSYPLHQSQQ